MKPIQKIYFDNRLSQWEYVESVVYHLKKSDILILWDEAGAWFGFNEPYRDCIDNDTIVDYLIDAMEHGELSILNDGTIKF